MAILTLKGHISRALNFYNNHDSLYAAIGKYSKWAESDCEVLKTGYDPSKDYDLDPPVPSINDDFLELIGLKKIESAFMVVQDNENGTLEYRGTKWRIVSMFDENNQPTIKNVYKEGSRWVYISTTLTYDEIITSLPYRQVGIFSNVNVKGTPVNPSVLTPDDIEGAYVLEADFRRGVISEISDGYYVRTENDSEDDSTVITIVKGSDGVYTLDGVELDLSVDPVMFMPVATLEILDNRKPVYRDTDVRETIKIILEF